MRIKENILDEAYGLCGGEGALNVRILTLEALLDIRDSLEENMKNISLILGHLESNTRNKR